MAKFTLHGSRGDYLYLWKSTKESAIKLCDLQHSKTKVCETYFAPSPWDSENITEHGREIYRNY